MGNFTKGLTLCVMLSVYAHFANAQVKIGDNPTTVNKAAILELESTNKGLLFPRVNLTSTTVWGLAAGSTPVAGMMVYNLKTIASGFSGTPAYPAHALDGTGIYYWDGTGWVSLRGFKGDAGTSGTDGKTLLNGTIAPANTAGKDGDFYINTASNMIYGPKTAGNWPAGVSLVGPAGANGIDGVGGKSQAGTGINITGTGTATDPYVINNTVVNTDNQTISSFSFDNVTGILTLVLERGNTQTVNIGALKATASNGLGIDATTGSVELGGALLKPTTITTDAAKTLAIVGLQVGTATDKIVVVNGNGVLKAVDQSTVAPEPLQVQGSTNKATDNNVPAYLNSNFAVGDFTGSTSTKKLEVKGDFKALMQDAAGTYYNMETNNTSIPGGGVNFISVANNPNFLTATELGVLGISRNGNTLMSKIGNATSTITQSSTGLLASTADPNNKSTFDLTTTGFSTNTTNLTNQQKAALNMTSYDGITFSYQNVTGDAEGNYLFPRNNGAANQVLTTDGLGSAKLSWKDVSTLAPEPWQIQGTTDKATLNTQNVYQMGTVAIGKNIAQSDVVLDVEGTVRGGTGHTGTVGINSVAFGKENTASGENSSAFGQGSKATGLNAMAWGGQPTHGTDPAGRYPEASGVASTAWGYGTRATNFGTTAFGTGNQATGPQATAFGAGNIASGYWSTAFGQRNKAEGNNSTAFGTDNQVTDNSSTVLGHNNISTGRNELVLGKFNAVTTGTTTLLQVGNGTSVTARANALTILENGNIGTGLAIAPTERLDIGSGNVRIRNINTNTSANGTDRVVVADGNGVLKTVDQSAVSPEPWRIEETNNPATLNINNIYQNGNVGIGDFAAAKPVARLDVRGAVRSGTPHAEELDGTSTIGANSVALGEQNKVSGNGAVALGFYNTVSGLYGQAYGANNTVFGSSIAMLEGNTVAGNFSFVAGNGNTVDSGSSKAMILGGGNIVNGANNFGSVILGSSNVINADGYIMGELNENNAYGSLVLGYQNISSNSYETVLGHNNAVTTSVAGPEANQPLLQVGNGSSSTRGNALTILKNGNIGTDLAIAPTERLDIGSGNIRVRDINSVAGQASDKIVVADGNGVLKTVASVTAAPRFFYSPSVVLPTANTNLPAGVTYNASTQTFTADLYAIYSNQFGMAGNVGGAGRTAIKSPSATSLPVLASSVLEYFVTYFDNTVFDPASISLDDNGVMTYKVLPSSTVTEKTYMNIVFKVK